MADMRAGPRPDEVAARSFPTSFRGFDPTEVRGYLAEVASALAAAAQREVLLLDELAQARSALANPAVDESVLLAVLGDEAARVLQAAKEAAADIRGKADANAAMALDQAHSEAERLLSEAQVGADRVSRAADSILAVRTGEADNAVARMFVTAEDEATKLREGGLAEARSMVAEARAVRERMLGDLKRRVQRGEASLAVLRVGRERLLEAFGVVKDRLDDATHSLATAEARSRLEAEEEAERIGVAAADVVDRLQLSEPASVHLQSATPVVSAGTGEVYVGDRVEPPTGEPESEMVSRGDVDTGEPTGEVAAVVSISGAVIVEVEEDEVAPSPVFDSPAAAPSTGEVAAIAATGTEGNGIGRSRRRMLRLADEPAVRAEEQRLSQLRYLHRPRTGGEPDVHLPEDGMVVVEPPSAGEAVRVLRGTSPGSESPASRPAGWSGSSRRVEPGVTLLDSAPPEHVPAATPPAPSPVLSSGVPARTQSPGKNESPAAGPRKDAAALFARLRAQRVDSPTAAAPPSTSVSDEMLLQARDVAVEPVEHLLAKKVKRLLADHQNAVLDRLRAKRPPTALELLGEVEDLLGPLATMSEPLLRDAATAGAAAAGAPDASVPSADLARDVAANVVKDLRPRLEVAFSVEHPERRADRVNVAFREWRGERVGRLVGDAAHAAFARGHFVATAARTPLRWVADDGERPCADCEDNSLAGPVPKGTPFPTGHRHPPAHSGCRCLLAGPPDRDWTPTSSRH